MSVFAFVQLSPDRPVLIPGDPERRHSQLCTELGGIPYSLETVTNAVQYFLTYLFHIEAGLKVEFPCFFSVKYIKINSILDIFFLKFIFNICKYLVDMCMTVSTKVLQKRTLNLTNVTLESVESGWALCNFLPFRTTLPKDLELNPWEQTMARADRKSNWTSCMWFF